MTDSFTAESAEEYTLSLAQIFAGSYRQILWAHEQGIPDALGLTTRQWVDKRLGGYVKMQIPERQQAVAELTKKGLSNRKQAEILGVDESTIREDKAAGNPAPTPADSLPADADAGVAAGNPAAKEEAAQETRTRRDVSRAATALIDGFQLRQGDAREELAGVPESSVQLVLTDPPYGDQAEDLYRWLADWSARVLIPGGSLIVYTGQSRLDRDIGIFGRHLRYWWLLSMMHTRAQRLPGKFVMAEFKPVLWYVKEYRRGKTLVNDVLRSPVPDKDSPRWAQGEAGVGLLIEHLTEPGERIVDPFAGTGEWGRIAANMGRRWLGVDVAEEDQRADGVVVA